MKPMLLAILFLCTLFLSSNALAEEDDVELFGLELEELLHFGAGIVAAILFAITLLSYKRTKRSKLLFVSLAFLLFACKAFLDSSELFMREIAWIDPISSVLSFAIMTLFFFGLIKK